MEKEGVVVEFSNADRPNAGSTVQEAKRSKWLHFRAHQRSLSHLWDLKERQKHDYFLLFDGGAKQSGSFVTTRQLTHMFDLEDRGWGFIEALCYEVLEKKSRGQEENYKSFSLCIAQM